MREIWFNTGKVRKCAAVMFAVLLLAASIAGCGAVGNSESTSDNQAGTSDNPVVEIDIKDYGTIIVQLDSEAAPLTVENFVKLVNEGFYDGLTIHRVVANFVIQGGDPEGTGMGGSEETIKGEFTSNGVENNLSHTRGAISMARSSEYDSASSQFFIVHQDSTSLDGDYAVFGYVTEGMEVVDAICDNVVPQDSSTGFVAAADQPVINSIRIVE